MAVEISEGVVGLSVLEAELKVWNTQEAPGRPVVGRELGRDPELENFRLVLKFVTVFTMVKEHEARDVYLPAIVVLMNASGKKVTSLHDLKNLVGSFCLNLLLMPQTTP